MDNVVFYNKTINKKELKSIIYSTFESYGITKATKVAEILKQSGFNFATKAGISISIEDLKVPPTKDPLFLKNNKYIQQAYFYEKRGNINEFERFQKVIDSWYSTSELLKNQLVDFFKTIDPLNPVYIMAFSGARGNLSQVRQLVGMRGLMADPNGQIIDLPIKANFREGLTITDYVISSYGARKGIVDTALRTADSGYLTRRLVDVAQHIIIRELDCKTRNGIRVYYNPDSKNLNTFVGRVLAKPVINENNRDFLIPKNTPLTTSTLKLLTFSTELILRSSLTCESSHSICQKCYGWNLAKGQLVGLADSVGIIAAQSIGEPGTQLTMRTFHTGGVFTGESSNQIRAKDAGQILFASDLQTVIERTVYGEIILKVRNNTKIFILTAGQKLLTIPVNAGMLIFVQNKSFIKKGELIAEIPNINKKTIKQKKTVTSKISGEIQFQNLRFAKYPFSNNNGLLWIASGEVYNTLPNMVVKRAGTCVIRNNAFGQSKITLPISGIIKKERAAAQLNLAVVNTLFIVLSNSLYYSNNQYFIRFGSNLFFELTSSFDKKIQDFCSFGKLSNSIYSLPYQAKIFCSPSQGSDLNLVQKFALYLIVPMDTENLYKFLKLPLENYKIGELLNKRLVFPGEILLNCIEILEMSYCELVTHDDGSKISLKITPVTQCAVSNLSCYLLKKSIRFFHSFPIKFVSCLKDSVLNTIQIDQPFIESYFGFWNYHYANTFEFIPKYLSVFNNRKKYLGFLIKSKFSSNINSFLSEEKIISYLVSNNQYIYPYTIIATINNIVKVKTSIFALKNLRFNNTRFLVSTTANYKTYSQFSYDGLPCPTFIVIGDRLGYDNLYMDYSGFKIPTRNNSGLTLRISLPFFISIGAQVLVQHGHLIQKGEPLCQLISTRVVSDDIVTGLPRIANLLEARNNDKKDDCLLVENPGIVKSNGEFGQVCIIEKREVRIYRINKSSIIPLRKGEIVRVAQPLQMDLLNPHKVLEVYFKYYCSFYSPERAAKHSIGSIQILLLNLVQDVYRSQGIYIADKHVEIIIRQITSKVRILTHNVGSFFVLQELIDFEQICYINRALKNLNTVLIEYQPVLVGITKVSLLAESFVSAASFQETTRILAQAAIDGRVEWLRGLKENVILGRLIPAGTGFKSFNTNSLLNIRLNG